MFMTASLIQDNIIPLQEEDSQRLTTLHKIFLANAKDLLEDTFSKLNSIVIEGIAGQPVPLNRYFTLNFGDNKALYITGYGTILTQPYQTSNMRVVSFWDFFLGELRKTKPDLLKKDSDLNGAEPVILEIIKGLNSKWFYELFATKTGGLLSSMNLLSIEYVARMPNQGLPETAAILRLRSLMSDLGMSADLNNLTLTSLIGRIYNAAVIALENPRSPPSGNLPEDLGSIKLFGITNGSDIARILYLLKNSSSYLDRNRFSLIQARFKGFTSHSFDIGLIANPETTYEKKFIPQRHTEMNSVVGPPSSFDFIGISNEAIEKKLYEPKIYITSESFSTALDFAGAGMLEIVLLSYLAEGVQNKVVIIDEPAHNLHQSKQTEIREWFKNSAKDNGNQFILITHSPSFLDEKQMELENVYIIRQITGASKALNLSNLLKKAIGNGISEKNIQKLYLEFRRIEFINMQFSKGVVFVEGQSDQLVAISINGYLSKKLGDIDVSGKEWQIIAMNGKDNLKKYVLFAEIVTGLGYCAIVDRNALMHCNSTMRRDGNNLNVSTVIRTLLELNLLSTEECGIIKDLQKNIIEKPDSKNQMQPWYNDKDFGSLKDLAKAHSFFVLSGDLEDILGIPKSEGDKPYKSKSIGNR